MRSTDREADFLESLVEAILVDLADKPDHEQVAIGDYLADAPQARERFPELFGMRRSAGALRRSMRSLLGQLAEEAA